jgi:hypothetical protein
MKLELKIARQFYFQKKRGCVHGHASVYEGMRFSISVLNNLQGYTFYEIMNVSRRFAERWEKDEVGLGVFSRNGVRLESSQGDLFGRAA